MTRPDIFLNQRQYGNGLTETRQYDLQRRLVQTDLTGLNQTLMSYDANGNLLSRQHDQTDNHYQYDELNRLYGDTQGSINNLIDYDANGNRVQLSTDSFTKTYGYSPQSNQLSDIDTQTLNYDAAGNLTEDTQGRSYSYNNAGRLKDIQQSGQTLASYLYNSQGQRTQKTTGANTTVYHYDLTGQLISETQADGTPIKDYLWHNGNPIAQVDINTNNETISYLHTDQLQTARLATDQSQQIVWQWEGNAFGDTPPQELANIQINLRFAGQYYDQETNLHYNWNRYYNPETGRYITSDRIGLGGGINTYGYVGGNPARFVDPMGLICYSIDDNGFLQCVDRVEQIFPDASFPDDNLRCQGGDQSACARNNDFPRAVGNLICVVKNSSVAFGECKPEPESMCP